MQFKLRKHTSKLIKYNMFTVIKQITNKILIDCQKFNSENLHIFQNPVLFESNK